MGKIGAPPVHDLSGHRHAGEISDVQHGARGTIADAHSYLDIEDLLLPRTATKVVAASNAPAITKFGADYVCTGTDDEVEINLAIAALPAWGGKVFLTTGTFTISAQISIGKVVTLEGEGYSTLIKVAAANLNINGIGPSAGVANCVLRNFRLDGTKASQGSAGQGIRLDWGVTDWLLENLWIENWKGIGVATDAVTRIIVRGVRAVDNDGAGFVFAGSTYCTFLQCISRDNGSDGFLMWGGSDGCAFFDCLSDGDAGSAGINVYLSDNARIIGCIAINHTVGAGIRIGGESSGGFAPVNGGMIVGCYAGSNATDGIDNYNVVGVTVNGCRSEWNGRNGFTLDYHAHYGQMIGNVSLGNGRNGYHVFGADHVRLEGNLARNNSYGDAGSYHGFHIEDGGDGTGDYAMIIGNRACDTQGTKTQEYGVKMTNTDHAYIFNNNLSDNRTGALSEAGSSNIIRGNVGVTPIAVTGARDAPEGALKDLLTDLATAGLITDSTTTS